MNKTTRCISGRILSFLLMSGGLLLIAVFALARSPASLPHNHFGPTAGNGEHIDPQFPGNRFGGSKRMGTCTCP